MSEAVLSQSPIVVPVNQSDLFRILTQSPLHCWTQNRHLNPFYEREESVDMDAGSIAHAVLLEGDYSRVVTLDFPDFRTKAAKEARDAAWADKKLPVLASRMKDIEAMVDSAKAQLAMMPEHRDAFTGGEAEKLLEWSQDGVLCRAKPDYVQHSGEKKRRVYDYKTTGGTANPERLSRQIFDMGYDIQGVLYEMAVEAVHGVPADFFLVTQENDPPYALSVVALSPSAKWYGQARVTAALALWKQCLASGKWPGYPTQTCWAELPEYLEKAWIAREEREIA